MADVFADDGSIEQADGAVKVHNPLEAANDHEKKLLEACTSGLKGNITKGIDFVKNPQPAK
jgi:malate dehydrogenase